MPNASYGVADCERWIRAKCGVLLALLLALAACSDEPRDLPMALPAAKADPQIIPQPVLATENLSAGMRARLERGRREPGDTFPVSNDPFGPAGSGQLEPLDVVVYFRDDDEKGFQEVVRELRKHGVEFDAPELAVVPLWLEQIDTEALTYLLAIGDLVYLEEVSFPQVIDTPTQHNVDAQDTHNVDVLHNPPFGLSGSGVKVGIWDGGAVLTTHQEFPPRATQMDSAPTPDAHATHVAGTIGARGAEPPAQGMAPKALLRCHDWTAAIAEMSRAATDQVVCTNHSYGFLRGWARDRKEGVWVWWGDPGVDPQEDYLYGKYRGSTAAFDRFVRKNPGVSVFVAAGNERGKFANDPTSDPEFTGEHWVAATGKISQDPRHSDAHDSGGYDTLEGLGLAKNVITVGAIEDITEDPVLPDHVEVTKFSSWGPPDDGRVKPDVVANGASLFSPTVKKKPGGGYQEAAYTRLSGTSMATPTAAGIGALLDELARQRRGKALFADEMKAVLIHTAMSPHEGPTYEIGWGSIRADEAGSFVAGQSGVLLRPTKTEEPFTWTGRAAGEAPLRVTLVWIDAEARPNTGGLDDPTPALVLDLDLILQGPGGVVHRPWALDRRNPDLPATRCANHVDNVERVDIEAPDATPGTWTVSVRGGAGQFALAISGLEAE